MPDQISSMAESLKIFWNQLIQFFPQLLIGIFIFIIGWIVAILLRKGMVGLFKLVRLDRIAEKSGIENFLIKGGAQYRYSKYPRQSHILVPYVCLNDGSTSQPRARCCQRTIQQYSPLYPQYHTCHIGTYFWESHSKIGQGGSVYLSKQHSYNRSRIHQQYYLLGYHTPCILRNPAAALHRRSITDIGI